MTRDELMALARQTGHIPDRFISASTLERFAALVTAAELRRLYAENEDLTTANEQFGKRQEWWNEKMFALEAQRDALLEALKVVIDDLMYKDHARVIDVARAAIARVEEKT